MISFVIPAHNEAQLLARTLRALHVAAREIGQPFEVIVCDDASTDSTPSIAEAHGARVVSVAHRKISSTRNSGAKAATGDVLVFIDADTLVDAALLRAALAALENGAVGGGCVVRFDGRVPLPALLTLAATSTWFRLRRWACGCFIFCRAADFHACSGFDETMFGAEEVAISRALKRRGQFVILKERAVTSGRKVRAFSFIEILKFALPVMRPGGGGVRVRENLPAWYSDRRDDPEMPG